MVIGEQWKPVIGWNGKYLISNYGNFKSIGGRYKRRYPDGYISTGSSDSFGYRAVTMRRPGHLEQTRIHVLVATHFIEPVPGKDCVNHIDGNKSNNHYSNLEWCTRGENIKHANKTGLINLHGERSPHHKLTADRVIEMRILRKEKGLTYKQLGSLYGVSRRQASDVVRGINWSSVPEF